MPNERRGALEVVCRKHEGQSGNEEKVKAVVDLQAISKPEGPQKTENWITTLA